MGSFPGMSLAGAGRVVSPRLGVGRNGVSIVLRGVSASFPLSNVNLDGKWVLSHSR